MPSTIETLTAPAPVAQASISAPDERFLRVLLRKTAQKGRISRQDAARAIRRGRSVTLPLLARLARLGHAQRVLMAVPGVGEVHVATARVRKGRMAYGFDVTAGGIPARRAP